MRALHDGVAQDLFLSRLTLFELAGRLPAGSPERRLADAALERVGAALSDTRALIDGVRSGGNRDRYLGPVLMRELVDFAARTEIGVSYTESGSPAELPSPAVTQVIGIVREALTNVHKHAQASEVRVHVKRRNAWIRLTVTDNGRGFRTAPAEVVETGLGFGMTEMYERARAIGAAIGLRSAASSGTTLTVDIPRGAM